MTDRRPAWVAVPVPAVVPAGAAWVPVEDLDLADPAWRPVSSQQGGLCLTAWRPARVTLDP